jgi:hypothetical protein
MCYNSTFIIRTNMIMCIQFSTITSSIFDFFFILTITISSEHGNKRSAFHLCHRMWYHKLSFHIIAVFAAFLYSDVNQSSTNIWCGWQWLSHPSYGMCLSQMIVLWVIIPCRATWLLQINVLPDFGWGGWWSDWHKERHGRSWAKQMDSEF